MDSDSYGRQAHVYRPAAYVGTGTRHQGRDVV